MGEDRLQKIVARAGLASRRAAERLIAEGRVRVNGKTVTELGTRVDARADRIEVDGRRLVAEKPAYLVLHKPRGVVSTLSDPEGRPSVREIVAPTGLRLFPVGRLDFHTSGVLLLTNDGEFCDKLLHPRRDVPKTYVAKVLGEMTEADRKRWEEGVELEDGKTRPAKVRLLRYEGGKTWLEITLFEGRNQQIRRMGDATGFRVMRLSRLSFAGVTGEGLRPGEVRELTPDELFQLREEYGVPRKIPKGSVLAEVPRRPVARPRAEGTAHGHAAGAKRAGPTRSEEARGRRGPARVARTEEAPAKGTRRAGPARGGKNNVPARGDAPLTRAGRPRTRRFGG